VADSIVALVGSWCARRSLGAEMNYKFRWQCLQAVAATDIGSSQCGHDAHLPGTGLPLIFIPTTIPTTNEAKNKAAKVISLMWNPSGRAAGIITRIQLWRGLLVGIFQYWPNLSTSPVRLSRNNASTVSGTVRPISPAIASSLKAILGADLCMNARILFSYSRMSLIARYLLALIQIPMTAMRQVNVHPRTLTISTAANGKTICTSVGGEVNDRAHDGDGAPHGECARDEDVPKTNSIRVHAHHCIPQFVTA
jgi:hypothetical protein